MANRRMFSLKVVDTDGFLDMSPTAQLLYFHLAMRADDDGFVSSPKKIMKLVGTPDDDMKILVAKQFIIPFQSGVIVIKHWKEHNYIQNDRKHDTVYKQEFAQLSQDENGYYELKDSLDTKRIQDVSKVDTEVRLGKVRLGKEREITPAQEAKEFFEGNYEGIFNEFQSKLSLNSDLLRQEFQKFILYWTEKNKSGTRQRWEQQATFEVRRRLATWLSKMRDFKNNKNQPNYIL